MTDLIHHYGGWVVFILVFFEAMGLPIPGETILVSAAIYAGTTQHLSIGVVLVAAIIGTALGGVIGFYIGKYYGYPLLLRYGSYVGMTDARIKIAQYLFQRQGITVVVMARFVAVLRSAAALVAGANQMPFGSFMVANVAGTVAWVLLYGLASYYLGKEIEKFARPVAFGVAVIGAIAIVTAIRYWRRKERILAAEAERAIPGPLRATQR